MRLFFTKKQMVRSRFGYIKSAVFFVVGKKIVLTNGFTKKTQKTPKSEIELAKRYRADYLSRKEQRDD